MEKVRFLASLLTALLLILRAGAIEVRVATYNIRQGLEASGNLGRDAAESVLARINPDIIGLQEVYEPDWTGNPSTLDNLASSLNYPHVFVPSGAIDPQSRVVILSKYPFLGTWSILSPAGANEMTRAVAAARVDIPGTDEDPIVINAHLKCCGEFDDPFRRAVEMFRINEFLTDQGVSHLDNIFLLGDLNLVGSNTSFNSLPSGLPPSYQLGNDISFPISYSTDPVSYFSGLGLINPGYRQQNGTTTWTHTSGSILDHILVSTPIANNTPQTEIFQSSFDATIPGLPKFGPPLSANTSSDASDHLLVFGDFELEGGESLAIQIASASVTESSAPVNLTVTLPSAPGPGESVTVNLSSSDSSEIIPSDSTLSFSSGQISASTSLLPRPDLILDGDFLVTIQASASGYTGASAEITVLDSDSDIYQLTEINAPWIQTFTGFNGDQAPAAWTTSNNDWQGPDDGSLEIRGPRSYGGSSLGSLSGSQDTFTAAFQNTTGSTIKSLSISYLAQQWRSFQDGSVDQWKATLIIDGVRTEIPDLIFTSDSSQPSGPLDPPTKELQQGVISGINISSGQSFQLEFEAIPETLGAIESDDVFINEFHYDNISTDTGEFVEIVVGPGYTKALSTIQLVLYNGNGGATYNSIRSLDTFMPGNVCNSCHRLFYTEIAGIQNGSPDGMALVVDGVVRQFISYEGSFTATNGPAIGMTSTDLGISQTSSTPVGKNSLGLSGDGANLIDFSWEKLPGNHTPGQINPGQSFSAGSKPQGIAIDNLILIPSDQSNGVSNGIASIGFTTPNMIRLEIPTWEGLDYELESSADLLNWNPRATQTGDGLLWTPEFPVESQQFFRLKFTPLD